MWIQSHKCGKNWSEQLGMLESIVLLYEGMETCLFGNVPSMDQIFRCQMIQGKKEENRVYKGSQSITENQKMCIPWSRFDYLQKINYPTLDKNYCRNPQGYGDRSWCYVGKDYSWEYCVTFNPNQGKNLREKNVIQTLVYINKKYIYFCSSIIPPSL